MLGLMSGLFDTVVLGEGEATLLELYERFRSTPRKPVHALPGAMVLDHDGGFTSSDRPLLVLSDLPLPSYTEMDLD